MSDEIAIAVENVSKAYRIWESPAARLTSPLQASLAGIFPANTSTARWFSQRSASSYRDFHALRNISFSVKRGEAVGIIGRNGSGKSTLLQILASTLRASEGSVRVSGRVAALLELGSGFNPEFTGRENVFLNGAVLGFTHAEMEARFDGIAAFADIGDFIDQPVKTYSSGMMMRLAFAVQITVEPDILIVDEALSVGDAQFVAKCIKRVSDFLQSGRTLLFVSHDVGLVKQLTSRSLYLEKGRQIAFDATPSVVLAYAESLAVANNDQPVNDPDRYSSPTAAYSVDQIFAIPNESGLPDVVKTGEPFTVKLKLGLGAVGDGHLVFSVYNYMGLIVCSGSYDLPKSDAKAKFLEVTISMPHLRLAPGSYRMNIAVRNKLEIMSWARNAVQFRVAGDTTETFIYREDTLVAFEFS